MTHLGIFGGKKAKEERLRRELLRKIDGKHVSYAIERLPEGERVLGKNGSVNLNGGELVVLCDGQYVFRADLEGLEMGELLNLSGLAIDGHDKVTGRRRKVVAYYSYYRK